MSSPKQFLGHEPYVGHAATLKIRQCGIAGSSARYRAPNGIRRDCVKKAGMAILLLEAPGVRSNPIGVAMIRAPLVGPPARSSRVPADLAPIYEWPRVRGPRDRLCAEMFHAASLGSPVEAALARPLRLRLRDHPGRSADSCACGGSLISDCCHPTIWPCAGVDVLTKKSYRKPGLLQPAGARDCCRT
jgi:hypothetical protein